MKTKKIEFHTGAVIYTMSQFPELQPIFANEGRFYGTGLMRNLLLIAESRESAGKMRLHLVRLLRNHIETSPEKLSAYKVLLAELKSTEERQENEFAIKIVGSGTKEDIIRELETMASVIRAYTLEELRNGIEEENSCTMLTTDLPETYE